VSDYRLMIPGPVDSEDDVLSALAEPTLPHYGPLWMPLFDETTELLKKVFQTEKDVLMVPGPGTGALEMAIASLAYPGHSVAVVTNGHFGRRANRIIDANGINALPIVFPSGEPADPDVVRQRLAEAVPLAKQNEQPIEAIVYTHHETSTGILNPLGELSAVAHEFDLQIIVDAVSSLGGVELPVDAWGIDACVTVPNKCIAAVPGVALMSVSQRAWETALHNPGKHGWYYDLRTWALYRDEWAGWHPYPTTLPTNLIAALHRALIDLLAVGLEPWIASHAEAARKMRIRMAEMGFTLYPNPDHAAPIITAFNTRPDVNPAELSKMLLNEHGIVISGGLDELAGRIFRVGHMGKARSDEYIAGFLDAVRAYLEMAGLPLAA
jgi:alanine-glyoxylate transaminase / serine-glyoxylate transaminase / serine-pyruvate transaminase